MVRKEIHKKRVYDETASLITHQAIINKLDADELHFLLHLLDGIFIKDQHRSLLEILHRWKSIDLNKEVNLEIKKILLKTDLNNENQVNHSIAIIEEILCAVPIISTAKEESEDERLLDL